jgi:hypothetical protein
VFTFGKLLKGIDGVSGKILKKRMELYRKQQEKTRNHYCIMQKIATMCRTGFLDFSGVIFSGEPFSDDVLILQYFLRILMAVQWLPPPMSFSPCGTTILSMLLIHRLPFSKLQISIRISLLESVSYAFQVLTRLDICLLFVSTLRLSLPRLCPLSLLDCSLALMVILCHFSKQVLM